MGNNKRHAISSALLFLKNHPLEIMTVTEWAYLMGYSRSHFCRCFKKEFGVAPKRRLRVLRLRLIRNELRKHPHAIGYEVAMNAGFCDNKSLHQYISFHCNMNLSEFKIQFV